MALGPLAWVSSPGRSQNFTRLPGRRVNAGLLLLWWHVRGADNLSMSPTCVDRAFQAGACSRALCAFAIAAPEHSQNMHVSCVAFNH